jgi:hypothetical protein
VCSKCGEATIVKARARGSSTAERGGTRHPHIVACALRGRTAIQVADTSRSAAQRRVIVGAERHFLTLIPSFAAAAEACGPPVLRRGQPMR